MFSGVPGSISRMFQKSGLIEQLIPKGQHTIKAQSDPSHHLVQDRDGVFVLMGRDSVAPTARRHDSPHANGAQRLA